jgi:NAD(P)-dependent dehydrogenase (short-subunit alcohol dehydrogenase family)
MSAIDRFRLDGKVAIVTGGGGGIGQVYGRALAEAGASVVLADLLGDAAEGAASALTADGFAASGVAVDVTDRTSTDAMAAHAVSTFGGVDILVNNAALMKEIPFGDLLDVTDELFDAVMRVNVLGAIHCSASVRGSMLERGGGRIINQVSAGAFTPGGLYGISKIGLVSATATLATSLGPRGINVNAIAPGLVMTPAGFASLAEDSPIRAAIAAGIPGKKTAPAEDLVGALLLLASDAGAWINGQTLSVDGGWVIRL